jgi:hypothetical protein
MAEDTEVSAEVSAITKAVTKQTHEAVDAYFDFLKNAISSYPSGGTKLGEKLKSHAEQNVTALHEYVTKLSEAKTVQDAIRIQTEFVQTQFTAFSEQTKDLVETYSKAVESVTIVPST